MKAWKGACPIGLDVQYYEMNYCILQLQGMARQSASTSKRHLQQAGKWDCTEAHNH